MASRPSFMRPKKRLNKVLKSKLLPILFVAFLWSPLQAQETDQLRYVDFIQRVKLQNPLIKKSGLVARIGQAQFDAAKGWYDPQIQSGFQSKTFDGKNYYNVFQGEVKQGLITAQNIKFGYERAVGNVINPEDQTSDAGIPYLGLEIGLLQGLMIDKRRAELLKSKAYAAYYESEGKIQLNQVLAEASTTYADWLFVNQLYSIQQEFLSRAQERFEATTVLAAKGERAGMDSIEARLLVRGRALELDALTNDLTKSEQEIRIILFDNLEQQPLKPSDQLDDLVSFIKSNIKPYEPSYLLTNPFVEKQRAMMNVNKVEERFRKELIKPELNLSYNFLADYTAPNDPRFSINNNKWSAKLAFPLFQRRTRNEFRLARAQAQISKLELDFKTNELDKKSIALSRQLEQQQRIIQDAQVIYEEGRLLLEAERLRFELGESTLFLLNTRENKLLEYKVKLAETKLKYVRMGFALLFLQGQFDTLN